MQLKLTEVKSKQESGYLYGILTNEFDAIEKEIKILYLENLSKALPAGFLGYILLKKDNHFINYDIPNLFTIDEPFTFNSNQIIIKIDFTENVIWQIIDLSKNHIDLYLTGKCTQFCIACPQPQKFRKDLEPKNEALMISKVLINQKKHINISGGEPTFNKSYFVAVLKALQSNSPESNLQILTNALSFSKEAFILEMVEQGIVFEKLFFSIAIYGSNPEIQDFATGLDGSFYKLENAIQNINNHKAKIELRIVINKINLYDLENISKLIVEKYHDKITRVIFMGLEMSGDAEVNHEKVWIPFNEHKPFLLNSIIYLLTHNINVLLYNYPLCYLPKQFWSLAKDSISYWKKYFHYGCDKCQVKSMCAGFFESTLPYIEQVTPILIQKDKHEVKTC
ncbi:MAG: radical SAM protein [Ignavibacteriales bacterium]|nr:radical SAM protein [Ignavibacteriales bacterium]MCF8435920.1 radical SAM protein [Ignavibacteriales bacterium]